MGSAAGWADLGEACILGEVAVVMSQQLNLAGLEELRVDRPACDSPAFQFQHTRLVLPGIQDGFTLMFGLNVKQNLC